MIMWLYKMVADAGLCNDGKSHIWRLVAEEDKSTYWCCRGCDLLKSHNFVTLLDYFYVYEEVDDVNE